MIQSLMTVFSLLFVVGSAQAQWEDFIPRNPIAKNVQCGQIGTRSLETFRYCTQLNPQSQILVVNFHGAGSTEESFFRTDKPEPVYQELRRQGSPSVVSISIGRFSWLGTQRANQYEEMADKVASLVKELRMKAPIQKVNFYGVSMGGFNGLQMLIHADHLFDRWVLSCPALTEADPFDDNSWANDPDTKAANSFSRSGLRYGLKKEFENSSNWQESNPMNTLKSKNFQGRRGMKVLVTTVGNDGFGFINTPVTAAKILKAQGLDVNHVRTDGAEHCKPTAGPVAQFLMQ